MVWELPELALVHVFPTTSRVWALWGDRKILASAGADSLITLRSMETGAILSRLKRPGHVFALWGPPDGTLIVSAGACKTSDTNTTRQTLNNLLNVQGSIVLRHLKPQHVLFRCATNLHDAQTTCMWSNGTIVACGGLEFVTVVGFRSGKILADFAIKTIVTGVWCFELDLGWVVVIAFRKNMLAIKIETGETIKEWEFPSHVHIHGDNTHNRLIAVGTWGLAIYNLSDLSAEPTCLDSLWQDAIELQTQLGDSVSKGEGEWKVRCMWMPEDGFTLAYAIKNLIFLRVLQDQHRNDDFVTLIAPDKVSSMWGSADGKILVTGHFLMEIFILWCLCSGKELRRIDCDGHVKSVSGYGRLLNPSDPLTIVAGTDKTVNSISLWKVKSSDNAAVAENHTLSRQASARWGSRRSFGQQIFRSLEPGELTVEPFIKFSTRNGVNCLHVTQDGSTLCVGGRDKYISFYRLDTLSLCGPSMPMLKRSSDASLDISQHKSALGPLLMEGTMMEWILKDDKVKALETLLHHRPGAALLPLPDGTSTFDTAIRLRRSRILATLLKAVVNFTMNGEESIAVHGWEHPEPHADYPIRQGAFWRLPSPALRRVTDCFKLALRLRDMTEVVKRFLNDLPLLHLDYFEAADLPFVPSKQFLGSSSSSGLTPGSPLQCIWRTKYKELEHGRGFPAMATVMLLPGLTDSSLLSLLARQSPDILVTPPIRTLLDAMRYNGIQDSFYALFFLFTVLIFTHTVFVAAIVDLAHGNGGRLSWFLRAGALLVSDKCQDRSLSKTPEFFLCMICGCVSVLMGAYYFIREMNELFDHRQDDDDGVLLVNHNHEQGEANQQANHASWQNRLFQDTGLCSWENDESFSATTRQLDVDESLQSMMLRSEGNQAPCFRIMLTQNELLNGHPSSVEDQQHRKRSSIVSGVHREASLVDVESGSHHQSSHLNHKLKATAKVIASTLNMRHHLTQDLPSFTRSNASKHPWKVRHKYLSLTHWLRTLCTRLSTCLASASKTALNASTRNKINILYFKSFWNWLALLQCVLIWSTFISFILAWGACSESVCTQTSDAGDNELPEPTGNEGAEENVPKLRCNQAITQVRLCASLSIPVMYTYSLYYFRCFDAMSFYVRIIFAIIADMRYFIFIKIWLLFAFSTGIFALQVLSYISERGEGRGRGGRERSLLTIK